MPPFPLKTLTPTLLLILLLPLLLLLSRHRFPPPFSLTTTTTTTTTTTSLHHLLFSIASSSTSLPHRHPYISLWYSPTTTRAAVFLDRPISVHNSSLPPLILSSNTSHFPYTCPNGLRSAVRLARIVKEAFDRNPNSSIRWFVFGDDDTVFFTDNLVRVLGKYDHEKWYYIGASSESYEQNARHSFEMAFGGGGFAISYPLARVLARVFDSCLVRYAHLYGSDSRVYSCLAELGVGLTHEPGFHQGKYIWNALHTSNITLGVASSFGLCRPNLP